MTLQMITANRLSDGAVVYLAQSDIWSNDIKDGYAVGVSDIEKLVTVAEQAVQDCVIVAAYAIAVEPQDDGYRPVRFREQIRAQGPTVRAGRDA